MTGKHRHEDDKKIFHLGIIDYLQGYDCGKKLERAFKPIFKNCDPNSISSQHPKFYGNRFIDFMDTFVFNN